MCHEQGPGSKNDKFVPVTRHNIECRIETVLCYVRVNEDITCQEEYESCLDDVPDPVTNGDHDPSHFNSTMGELFLSIMINIRIN